MEERSEGAGAELGDIGIINGGVRELAQDCVGGTTSQCNVHDDERGEYGPPLITVVDLSKLRDPTDEDDDEEEHDDKDEDENDKQGDDQILKIVEYCVLCAEIANYFDLNGTLIKREAPPHSQEYCSQQLLTTFCESVGIPEDSDVFKIWNFDSFSFCSSCEHNLYQMSIDEDVQMKTSDYIMRKIEDAEEKFVNQDLYRQHDKRYLLLRRLILGDRCKGQTSIEDVDVDEEDADVSFVINNAEASQISEQILSTVPPKPSRHNLQIRSKEQTEGDMKIKRNSVKDNQTNENEQTESSETATASQTTITDSVAASGTSNSMIQNEENIPPPNVFNNQKTKEKSEIPRFSMELRSTTNFIKVAPNILSEDSGVLLDEESQHTLQSSPTDGRSLNETEGTNKVGRKRGRPRKNDCEVAKKLKRSPSSFTDISNRTVTERTKMVGRKRGRPRKINCEVTKVERSSSSFTDLSNTIATERTNMVGRKRGRPRKNNCEVTKGERSSSSFTDISNRIAALRAKIRGRKRGRPRKYECEVVTKKLKRSFPDVNNWRRQKDGETIGRKRGRPRKNGCELVKKYKKTSMKTVRKAQNTNMENEESSAGDLYSKVDMIPDPITPRNYFYRALLFVQLEDTKYFQCSTCSTSIPYGKNMEHKFYIHYLISHSNCFECEYCVDDNRFNSFDELQHHMLSIHRRPCPRAEVESKLGRARNSIYNTRPPPTKMSSGTKGGFCPICEMPVASFRSDEYKKHYYTHLNSEEKSIAIKKEKQRGPLPGTWKRGRMKRADSHVSDNYFATGEETLSQDNNNEVPNEEDTVEQEQNQNLRKCTLCGVRSSDEESFRNHLKLQHNTCQNPTCDKSFGSVDELQTHIEVDHNIIDGNNQHYCGFCGNVFDTSRQARRHTLSVRCKEVKAEISDMLSKL